MPTITATPTWVFIPPIVLFICFVGWLIWSTRKQPVEDKKDEQEDRLP